MARSIFFYNAADQASVSALTGALSHNALQVATPVPAPVRFGVRVVVVWSRHAAADYQDGHVEAPANALVVQLDDTPLPPALAALKGRVVATGDWVADSENINRLLSGPVITARAAPAMPMRRAVPAARPVGAMRRRQAQSASMVTAAGAMGTLAAFALGAVVPSEQFVTPSFASPNPVATPSNEFERHEHLAVTRPVAAEARFQGVLSANGVPVTFSAEEIGALNQQLSQSEQALASARGWSDEAMTRLQSLSASEPAPMPSMAAVPQAESPRMAQAPRTQPAVEAASAPQLALRERFTQVEPIAYAVDRLSELSTPAQGEAQPLAAMASTSLIDG